MTAKIVTSDDHGHIDVIEVSSRHAGTYHRATIAPCREGWHVTGHGLNEAYARGDLGRALLAALGIADRPTLPAAVASASVVCPWCGLPPDVCPDWAGHDRADRASETIWRRLAVPPKEG